MPDHLKHRRLPNAIGGAITDEEALPLQDDESKRQRKSKKRSSAPFVLISMTAVACLLVIDWKYRGGGFARPRFRRRSSQPYYTLSMLPADAAAALPTPRLLHMFHTRFMQEQAQLKHLAHARLMLWQHVCLPSMLAQHNQNFVWIIKVDPNLDLSIVQAMVTAIGNARHIYVVASNHNFRINQNFPGAWKDGAEGVDLVNEHAKIYTGDATLLSKMLAYAHYDDVLWLESRLDADDGLAADFVAQLQTDALLSFYGDDNRRDRGQLRWKYWCVERVLEWHWQETPHEATVATGQLVPAHQGKFHWCPTPGITVAFAAHTREANVPIYGHHEILQTIPRLLSRDDGCGRAARHCLGMVSSQLSRFDAVRARTPTSAGMLQVVEEEQHADAAHEDAARNAHLDAIYWQTLALYFGIQRDALQTVNAHLTLHMWDIAHDNFLGQCTTGHSCKENAKQALQELMNARQGNQSLSAA